MKENDYDVVTWALIVGAKLKAEQKRQERRRLRELETPVNLPLYGIEWREKLTYRQFLEKYNNKPLLSHQLPQCHICTRFHTDENPLFAYSILESENDHRLIYRCQKGHSHDHGMTFADIQTGLTVYV